MTALLELKQKIKNLYGQYEVYILPVLRFVLGLVYFFWINANMGYMTQLNNVFLVVILALMFYFTIRCDAFCGLCTDDRTWICAGDRGCRFSAGADSVYDDSFSEIQRWK